ncbi:MAG TPA: ABC transporter permease [Acidimicrobiales bacterium]|nr:ABC transporter permease [Acidimicrobiales bacterium]
MRYILRKLLLLIPVLFVVTFLTSEMIHLLPGSPCYAILKANATAANVAKCTAQLHLNRPIPIQYVDWVRGALSGHLGQSYLNDEPVSTVLAQSIPVTLELLIFSQIIAVVIAIPLGILSAYRANTRIDRVATTAAFGTLSVPDYVRGVLLVFLFAVTIHWFPATGYTHITDSFVQNIRSVFLPSLALGLGSIALYQRVLRADMIATLQEDFITMARAKGMPTWWILLRHAFRPSTFSLVTIGGLNVGALVGGTFIVEYLFAIPGIGFNTVNAILQNDYQIVQGAVLLVVVAYVMVNFLLDLSYPLLDPRVRDVRAAA